MSVIKSYFKPLLLVLVILLTSLPVTASTITITSLPSATATGLPYIWTTNTWENYCPLCGHYDTLTINPKRVFEQELTCSYCDADYCGSSGYDKNYNVRDVLIKAEIPLDLSHDEIFKNIYTIKKGELSFMGKVAYKDVKIEHELVKLHNKEILVF